MTTDERTRRLMSWRSLGEAAALVALVALGVLVFAAADGSLGSTLEPVGGALALVFSLLFTVWLLTLVFTTGRGVVQGWREGGEDDE